MPYFSIRFRAKTLLDSIWVATLVGPKAGMPNLSKWSTMPEASGASGPTTTRSMLFSLAALPSASMSVGRRFRFSAIAAVPAFPGATNILSTRGLWAIFQTRVCSRPPPPTTSIFKSHSLVSGFKNGPSIQHLQDSPLPVSFKDTSILRSPVSSTPVPARKRSGMIVRISTKNGQRWLQRLPVASSSYAYPCSSLHPSISLCVTSL